MSDAISVTGLTKTYPNGTRAVREITCQFSADDMTIILGPSGAGKSTFLRCLNLLTPPTDGQVLLNGEPIADTHGGRGLQRVRKRCGFIFQQFNLVPRLTVLENVLAGRLAHNRMPLGRLLSLIRYFPRAEKNKAFDCLKKVRIESLAHQRADTLSGGQQQRVSIARALAQEPEVFLADEPVASLDPASARIVLDTLKEIHDTQQIPVIINLHQIDLARIYGSRILGMSNGCIVFDGDRHSLTAEAIETIYGQPVSECPVGLPDVTPIPIPEEAPVYPEPIPGYA